MKTTILTKLTESAPVAPPLKNAELAWQESILRLWIGKEDGTPFVINEHVPIEDFIAGWYHTGESDASALPAPADVRAGNTVRIKVAGTNHGISLEVGDIILNQPVGEVTAFKVVGFDRISGGTM